MAMPARDQLKAHYPALTSEYFNDIADRWLDGRLTLGMTTDLLLAERQRKVDEDADRIVRPLTLIFGTLASIGISILLVWAAFEPQSSVAPAPSFFVKTGLALAGGVAVTVAAIKLPKPLFVPLAGQLFLLGFAGMQLAVFFQRPISEVPLPVFSQLVIVVPWFVVQVAVLPRWTAKKLRAQTEGLLNEMLVEHRSQHVAAS